MCETCASEELIRSARHAADEMLTGIGVPIAKGRDVSSPRGFDATVARIAAKLRRVVRGSEAEALRRAWELLDVDWRWIPRARQRERIAAAVSAAGKLLAPVTTLVREPIETAAREVMDSTRSDVRRRHGLVIGADFNAVDRRAVAYVTRANCLFVHDEYGRRLDTFGKKVREAVARGLEQGLGRSEIADDLSQAAEAALVQSSTSYWEVVAASFVGESRSFSQVSAFAEAGIAKYVFSAVLDQHTTNVCRFMDGKVLQVADALGILNRLEASDDPATLKTLRPWARDRRGEDGKTRLVVGAMVLSTIERSGVGTKDDRGDYSSVTSSGQLAGLMPPLHGYCRSTLLPG